MARPILWSWKSGQLNSENMTGQRPNLYTRSDVALGLLAIFPIEVELDIRKLILFGQFCRLNLNCWVKTLFLYRLTSFNINPNRQTGFIVEIHRLLRKYQLIIFCMHICKMEFFQEN